VHSPSLRLRYAPVASLPSPEQSRRALRLGAIAVAGAVLAVAGLRLLLWSGDVPAPEAPPADRFLDPEALRADEAYQRGLRSLTLAQTIVTPAVAVALVALRRWWQPPVLRLAGGRTWLAAALFGVLLALVTALALLPIQVWRYGWVRAHDVGRQPLEGWLLDRLQAALVEAAILGLALAALAVAIRLLPRAWWVALGVLIAALVAALALLAPLAIAPLFERTTPLRDPALVNDVRAIADRADVEVGGVVVSDASRRTRAVNARVEGLGGTQRVVLDDTLTELPRDQAAWVVAHEIAHVHHRHVLKGVIWLAVLALPLALLVYAVTVWATGSGAAPAGAAGVELVLRRVAVAAAAIAVLSVLLTPLGNRVSRAYEAEADWTAFALTDDPRAAIDLRRSSRALSRSDPDPPRLYQLWFGTHPTPMERIGLALRAEQERR
jgi:STE24 endopeptidase